MPNKVLIIDGYNVIHKIPETRICLESSMMLARERLAYLASKWKAVHTGFDCIIVFDGRNLGTGRINPRIGGIKCIFSASLHGADEEIVRLVKKSSRPSDITVISDDNYVYNNCRAHGAQVRPSDYLLDTECGQSLAKPNKSPDGKGLDSRTAEKISSEMRKKWKSK
jgi:predicted RNA-binding protein with PIN domain